MTESIPPEPRLDLPTLYRSFNSPVTSYDCGKRCAIHNPNGIPFCCDICHAVPVAYRQEWDYLQTHTDLWHLWRGDECACEPCDPAPLQAETPPHLVLLACKGPALCQRPFRATSCRQFPFFPYITANNRFIGLAYDWDFEERCYLISHLGDVTPAFRAEFVHFYDFLFDRWGEEYESYANLSEDMRQHFSEKKRRIAILHRSGGTYLLSPASERLRRVDASQLPRFGPYR